MEPDLHSKAVVDRLCRAGPTAGPELQRALGLSKSAFQRAVVSVEGVLVTGRARATRYAARRSIEGLTLPLEVHETDGVGGLRLAFTLHPVEPFGFWVDGHVPEVPSGYHETDPRDLAFATDLPWFLQELRPAGFLGRAWAHAHVGLGWPGDPERWPGDDSLRYAALYGWDLPGAFVFGRFALDQLQHAPRVAPLPEGREGEYFPAEAERALTSWPWGSSAGGDQPKFTHTTVGCDGVRSWITKFSPPIHTPGGRRWADLLVAEHLTHRVLRDHGVEACHSRLVDAGGRRFLQVERFDRHGEHGRSGLISLNALDRAGVARDLGRWSALTARLAADGVIRAHDHERVRWLEVFGELIANTDMHAGNLSFRLRGATLQGLAPVYDMLPMFHAPRHGGELPRGLYVPRIESPFPTVVDAARELWTAVADRSDVSDDFRAIALDQRSLLP